MTEQGETLRRRDVAAGSRWSFIATVAKQVGRTVLTLVLALFLTPTSFGIVSQATLYIALTAIFVDAGFSIAVIQRKRLEDRDVASAFWLTTLTSGAFGALTIAIAPLVADFFDTPEVADVLRVLSISVLLKGLALVPMALLTRRLDMRRVAYAEIAATVVGGVAGVGAAAGGADYWAIVVQTLVHDAIALVLFWVYAGRIPLRASPAAARTIARFGAPVMGAQIVQYGSRNADNLLVARFEGTEQLAFYGLGYRVVLLPQQLLMQSAARVAVPVFGRLQDDPPRAARYFRDATSLLVLVIGLVMVGVVATAPEMVPTVLGDEWTPAARPMQILAVGGMLQVIAGFTGPLLLGVGRTRANLGLMVYSSVVMVGSFAIGLQWGIRGVATGFVIANVVILPVAFWVVRGIVGVQLRALGTDLVALVTAFAAAAAASRGAAWAVDTSSGPLVTGLAAGAVSVVAYAAVVFALLRGDLVRLLQLGRQIFSRSPA